MRSLYPDWRAPGLTVCLHEHAGGFAFNKESMHGLADKARARRRRRSSRASRSPASRSTTRGAVTAVHDERGTHRGRARRRGRRPVDRVAVGDARPAAPGSTCASPTAASPRTCRCGPTGTSRRARSPSTRRRSSPPTGASPPVLHVDSDAPLHADDGRLVTDEPWGIYFKPDRESVQGGAAPLPLGPSSRSTRTRPAPSTPASPTCGRRRCRHCLERFEGVRPRYRQVRSGGRRAPSRPTTSRSSTTCAPNVFVAADSNHGYKMIAVGREIARVLQGETRRCCARSATSASRPGTCTRSRTARTPGASERRERRVPPRRAVGAAGRGGTPTWSGAAPRPSARRAGRCPRGRRCRASGG